MKRASIAASTFSLLLLSTTAFADNLSGYYVGANAAISESFSAKFAEPSGISSNLSASDTVSSLDAVAGYNLVMESNLFIGGEAFYTSGGAKDDTLTDGTTSIQIEKEDAYGVKGKLGFAVNESSAVYGILGYSNATAKLVAATNNSDVSDSDDFDAYTFGVGGIYSVGQNFLVTVEGTYSDFDKQDYDTFSIDPDETRVTLGLAYRFDI